MTNDFYKVLFNDENSKIYSFIDDQQDGNELINTLTTKENELNPDELIKCLYSKLFRVSLFDEFCSVIDDQLRLYGLHYPANIDDIVFRMLKNTLIK